MIGFALVVSFWGKNADAVIALHALLMRRHVPGYSAINTTCNLLFGRLEGEAGDPLLRADTAKRDRAQEDRTDETVQAATTEPPVDGHFNVKEEAESLEKATAVKQVNCCANLQHTAFFCLPSWSHNTGYSIHIFLHWGPIYEMNVSGTGAAVHPGPHVLYSVQLTSAEAG